MSVDESFGGGCGSGGCGRILCEACDITLELESLPASPLWLLLNQQLRVCWFSSGGTGGNQRDRGGGTAFVC